MARAEQEPHLMEPVTIEKPTVLDLSRLLETQRISPEMSITCVSETHRATLYEVVDRRKISKLLKELEELDPFTQLRGGIIIHESPRK